VIFDSRREINVGKKGESEAPSDYFETFTLGGLSLAELRQRFGDGAVGTGKIEQDGVRWSFAYRQVGSWTLIAAGSQPSS